MRNHSKNSDEKASLSLDCAIGIMHIIPYIGVVFSFLGSPLLYRYHLDFSMSLKETLTFPSLYNPFLQCSELRLVRCSVLRLVQVLLLLVQCSVL